MAKKSRFAAVISVIFALYLPFTAVAANSGNGNSLANIPQKNGVYNVPNRSDLKVRVIVHYPKESQNLVSGPQSSCSALDPATGPLDTAGQWYLPGNWSYTINTASVPSSVGGRNIASITQKAFAVWTNAIGRKFSITNTGRTTSVNSAKQDGINLITWGTVTPNGALAVTYAMFYQNGAVAEVDTIMNNKIAWSWNVCSNRSYDAQDVLTHEFGHWMGLNDQYDATFSNNTMFGSASLGEIKKDTLTTGDVSGVRAIYP